MPAFKEIRNKCIRAVHAIDAYENSFTTAPKSDEETIQLRRTEAAILIAELAQMISNAAKVTETITETK